MKNLPKRIEKTLSNELGDFKLTRVVTEELNIGTTRYYICGSYINGYFAAWNEIEYFDKSDIIKFDNLDNAWNYINDQFTN